jgi:hypothetical protein
MNQCSSWKSIGHIAGRIPVSKGVFCQVGIKAAEGNEWKQCVDGTTTPAPPAKIYSGLCPGTMPEEDGKIHFYNDDIAAFLAAKDRSLQGQERELTLQMSNPDAYVIPPTPPHDPTWIDVLSNPYGAGPLYVANETLKHAIPGNILKRKLSVSDEIHAMEAKNRMINDAKKATGTEEAPMKQTIPPLDDITRPSRVLQDSPCSSWKSLGNIGSDPKFSDNGVYCRVGPTNEGHEWKVCDDGTTVFSPPCVIYFGLCPGSWAPLAKDRSLQDSPADQCSSWKSIGHIAGRIPVSEGVFCQVGPKAAEGNEWKQCVDGTTLPSPGMMVTGVCPGSVSAEQQAKLNSEVAAMLAAEKPAGKDRSLQDSTGPVAQCSSWKSIGHIVGSNPFWKGIVCQVGIGAAGGPEG